VRTGYLEKDGENRKCMGSDQDVLKVWCEDRIFRKGW
jgi:hypothetical protein